MKKFNLRVYGILLKEQQEVLLSEEVRHDFAFTKFPGGGLEWGEGITDCLKREFREELNIEVEPSELLYLTDYFQVSAFNENDQLLSIYYLVETKNKLADNFHLYQPETKEKHRWASISTLTEQDLTFPIDKLVLTILKKRFLSKNH